MPLVHSCACNGSARPRSSLQIPVTGLNSTHDQRQTFVVATRWQKWSVTVMVEKSSSAHHWCCGDRWENALAGKQNERVGKESQHLGECWSDSIRGGQADSSGEAGDERCKVMQNERQRRPRGQLGSSGNHEQDYTQRHKAPVADTTRHGSKLSWMQ